MIESTQLKQCFNQVNPLIYRNTPTSHKIINLKQPQKNIELKIILLSKRPIIKTKKGTISQFLVADETAAAYMNFYDQFGCSLNQGDILYVSGVYTTYYKQMLIINQGSFSIIKGIGRWYFAFKTQPNVSLKTNISFQSSPKDMETQQ